MLPGDLMTFWIGDKVAVAMEWSRLGGVAAIMARYAPNVQTVGGAVCGRISDMTPGQLDSPEAKAP